MNAHDMRIYKYEQDKLRVIREKDFLISLMKGACQNGRSSVNIPYPDQQEESSVHGALSELSGEGFIITITTEGFFTTNKYITIRWE